MRVVSPSLLSLQEYNLKYVDLIEEQLNEALTTYRKPVDGDNYVRRSNQRWERERGGRERERGGSLVGSLAANGCMVDVMLLDFPHLDSLACVVFRFQVTKTKRLSPCALVRPAGSRQDGLPSSGGSG